MDSKNNITLLPSFWLDVCENISEELVTMGSLLLKGCTVAVTGDDVVVVDALLLLSWIPVDDVSDAGTTSSESGSHFPVIINTRAIYNNNVGQSHMVLQAHLTCDYYRLWPGGAATVMREARTRRRRRRRRRHGWPDRSVDTSLPSPKVQPHATVTTPSVTQSTPPPPRRLHSLRLPSRNPLPPRVRCNSRDATDDPRALWAPTARPPPSRWY